MRDKVHAEQKIYYFPVRQFYQTNQSILEEIRKQDIVYTGSQSMYSEILPAISCQLKYYLDPFYKKALSMLSKRSQIIFQQPQHLAILSVDGTTSKQQMEGFIHICRKLKRKDANFRWYFYGDSKQEHIIRHHMRHLNVERNIIFVHDKSNILQCLYAVDMYVEWNKQPSIYYEAELLGKPIIKLRKEVSAQTPSILHQLFPLLETADHILMTKKFYYSN